MSKYNQSAISGEEYTRCNVITITNPLDRNPSISFNETVVTVLPNRVIENTAGNIIIAFDAAKVIPLRNPETGELTGQSITHTDMYVALYSAYIAEAMARDEAAAQPIPEQPVE